MTRSYVQLYCTHIAIHIIISMNYVREPDFLNLMMRSTYLWYVHKSIEQTIRYCFIRFQERKVPCNFPAMLGRSLYAAGGKH